MSSSAIDERRLVNGIAYNLARLAMQDQIDVRLYIDLSRRLASSYLNYTKTLNRNKVMRIATECYTSPIYQYVTEHEIEPDELLKRARAHALYFLGQVSSPQPALQNITSALNDGDITEQEAIYALDETVIATLKSLGAYARQRRQTDLERARRRRRYPRRLAMT